MSLDDDQRAWLENLKRPDQPLEVRPAGSRLGALIRDIRLDTGLTQADLARLCGVGQDTISNLETGATSSPQLATLERVALGLFKATDGRVDLSAAALRELTEDPDEVLPPWMIRWLKLLYRVHARGVLFEDTLYGLLEQLYLHLVRYDAEHQ